MLADERGFTLMELLVTALLMIIVSSGVLTWLEQTTRVASSEVERGVAIGEGGVSFRQMMEEIREAYAVNCPSAGCTNNAETSYLDFDVRTTKSGQSDRRVAYVCSIEEKTGGFFKCVRYETAASDVSDAVPLSSSCASCTSATVIRRVVSNKVFTNLTTGTSPSGAVRWTSGKATVYVPSAGSLAKRQTKYLKSDIELSASFYMSQLGYGK
jgi:Tfp pilus assembly protein PilV